MDRPGEDEQRYSGGSRSSPLPGDGKGQRTEGRGRGTWLFARLADVLLLRPPALPEPRFPPRSVGSPSPAAPLTDPSSFLPVVAGPRRLHSEAGCTAQWYDAVCRRATAQLGYRPRYTRR